MREILDILQRELVYVNYYFMVQLRQIAGYWLLGGGSAPPSGFGKLMIKGEEHDG